MGVKLYCITNRVNGKMYVGITSQSVTERWGTHKRAARRGEDYPFAHALRKYGPDNFDILCLFDYEDRVAAIHAECEIIAALELNIGAGYNASPGGDIWFPNEATRKKMSDAAKRRKRSPVSVETRAKISAANKGKSSPKWTAERYEHMKRVLTGQKRTPEAYARMSAAQKGRTLSQEHRDKIADTLRGRKAPEHEKEKRREYFRAHPERRDPSTGRILPMQESMSV